MPKTVDLLVLDYIRGEEDLVFRINPLPTRLDSLLVSHCSTTLVVLRSKEVTNGKCQWLCRIKGAAQSAIYNECCSIC